MTRTVADDILDLKYESKEVNKLKRSYYKTRKNRIKNKILKMLLKLCIEEKKIIHLREVVFIHPDIWRMLVETKAISEENLHKIKLNLEGVKHEEG